MAKVILNKQAEADLSEIIYYRNDLDIAERLAQKIRHELQKIADTPLIKGRSVKGISIKYKRWSILKNTYFVYFRRYRNGNIRVARIYSSKRAPLGPDEI